ncbi:MAG: rane protein of unknown function [Candidatus Saccharibacteria bacterium]|nr:rane protein of unknown function [Candidatus Saccharibacteria bacterium]
MVEVVSNTEPAVRWSAWRDEVSALASGALVGAATWILTYALSEYVIGQIACRAGSSIISCESSVSISAMIALIFASVAGLVLLVRRRVFRPLLVVLAAATTLWGVGASWLVERTLFDFVLTVLISALVYLVFAWFAKIRQFWLALGVLIVLVIVFRLMTIL